jgi:uncharacterized membrane protein YvlD (DUF360 family)
MKARFLRLNFRDFIKGLFLAIITAVLTFLTTELQQGTVLNIILIKRLGIAALIGFFSYILKNLLTNSKDEILTPEPTENKVV